MNGYRLFPTKKPVRRSERGITPAPTCSTAHRQNIAGGALDNHVIRQYANRKYVFQSLHPSERTHSFFRGPGGCAKRGLGSFYVGILEKTVKKGEKFKGIIPAVITPFKKNGSIDEKAFVKELQRMIANNVHGLSVGGSTGEGAFLRNEELATLIGLAKCEAGELPVVAGVIRPATDIAVETALAAAKAGADALMITPPYYNVLVPDADGNFMFYETISKAANLPIVIYNVVNQNEITTDQFARLLKIKNVMGIKQSLQGVFGNYEMVQINGKAGMIYCAADIMTYTCFDFGCDGAISAVTSLAPGLCVDMWNHARAGESKKGLAIQNRLYPLLKTLLGPQFPSKLKAALRELGYDSGLCRNPLHDISESERKLYKKMLDKTGRDWLR